MINPMISRPHPGKLLNFMCLGYYFRITGPTHRDLISSFPGAQIKTITQFFFDRTYQIKATLEISAARSVD